MFGKKDSIRAAAFVLIFGIAALLSMRVNFSQVLGAPNQQFTVFQFFGPIAGGFLGAGFGAVAVLGAQVLNMALFGSNIVLLDVLRLFTMVGAVVYFGMVAKNKFPAAIAGVCFVLFVIHPVGGQAWVYALYWLIPIGAAFFGNNLIARSLGATFTAHAIGGILWLYFPPTPIAATPGFWLALIPVVAFERLLFAGGIAASYIALNSALYRIEIARKALNIEPKYALLLK
jgi:hypothetical protein